MSIKNEFFLKKYDLLKKGSRKHYNQIISNGQKSTEELEVVSFQEAKRLVDFAYRWSTFYQEHYSAVGFSLGDLKSWSDFEQLPELNREHLVERRDQIVSEGFAIDQLTKVTTGGSSGFPVAVYHPKSVNRAAALWRMKSWWGLSPADDYGTVYRGKAKWLDRLKDQVVRWPSAMLQLDAASLTEDAIRNFINEWNKKKPRLLHGYVGGIVELALYVERHEIEFSSPDVIWTTSAPISLIQKRTLERCLGGVVFDQYGCCEVFYLAAEGPEREGLRIFNDLRKIEVVDEEGKGKPLGEEGRILITDYENYAFPLIRYENGDRSALMARPSDCSHPYALMHPVKGRQSDVVRCKNGTVLTGEYLTTIFDDYPDEIQQFKVHQNADASLVISVITKSNAEAAEKILESVREVVSRRCGEGQDVTMREVDQIGHDRGKLRFVTSDLA